MSVEIEAHTITDFKAPIYGIITIRKDVLNTVVILISVKNLLRFSLLTLETFRSNSFCTNLLFYDMNILNLSRDAARIFSVLLSI